MRSPSDRTTTLQGSTRPMELSASIARCAVCTARDARGKGHAARLIGALATRGERAFLHVTEGNAGAIASYERIVFEPHRRVTFQGFRTP
ncbi:GNAT family N-acetyltransferase [Streptomyces anulatus]